jgi:predicted transcriptional regulator
MPDESPTASAHRELAVKVVSAYLRRNQIAADQVAILIVTVRRALASIGKPAAEAVVERTPAVSIRRSVHQDYVVCLDCGWKGQMLRRHLGAAHGLTDTEYRARWNLRANQPITALGYSERRSTLAKKLGLGQRGRAAATSPPATKLVPKRRRRPRATAAPTAETETA